jgi:hypothetical protein
MPRYFFNVRDGREILDDHGTVLAGPDEARSHAVVAFGEMMKDNIGGRFWNDPEWSMRVTDESGGTVCSLMLSGR